MVLGLSSSVSLADLAGQLLSPFRLGKLVIVESQETIAYPRLTVVSIVRSAGLSAGTLVLFSTIGHLGRRLDDRCLVHLLLVLP